MQETNCSIKTLAALPKEIYNNNHDKPLVLAMSKIKGKCVEKFINYLDPWNDFIYKRLFSLDGELSIRNAKES